RGVTERQGVGPAAGRAEEPLVRGADGDEDAGEVVVGLAAPPDVVPFEKGEDLEAPAGLLLPPDGRLAADIVRDRVPTPPPCREVVVGAVVVVEGQADLLELVRALHARGGLADLLHGRQHQADERGDDGDYYQQLNEREAAAPAAGKATRTIHGRTPEKGVPLAAGRCSPRGPERRR